MKKPVSKSSTPNSPDAATRKVPRIKLRVATAEDYKKRQNWSVGTLHRASSFVTPRSEEPTSTPAEPIPSAKE